MKPLKVSFTITEDLKRLEKQGTVVNKYLGITDVRKKGIGDTVMNADFFLILSDDGKTYHKACSEVKIIPQRRPPHIGPVGQQFPEK